MADTNNNPKDPNAWPDFDEWGWDTYWSLNDWLTWHATLKQTFGQPVANDRWVEAWMSRQGILAFGDVRADWLTFNSAFREHLRNHNTSGNITMLAAITDPLTEIIAVPGEAVGNIGEGAVNLSGGVVNTTKTLKWLLPVALVVAVVLAAIIIYKFNPLKTIST